MPKSQRELEAGVVVDDQLVAVAFTYPADEAAGIPEYRDTLYVPADTPAKEIKAARWERYSAWRERILNPEPDPEREPVDPRDELVAAVTDAETAIARVRALLVDSGIELATPVVSSAGMNRQQRRALERALG